MSIALQKQWLQTYSSFDDFEQLPERGHCETNKGMETQPETEPAGMPESSLTKHSSLGFTSHHHDHKHLQEDKTSFPCAGNKKNLKPSEKIAAADVGSDVSDTSSPKMVETSSTELCNVTDGAKVFFEEEMEEKKLHLVSTCRITKDGFPDAETEKEFLESAMAEAVKFMACHSTVGILLNALTLLRFEASDCGLYPKDAQQFLKALDTVGSDDFAAKKFWEESSEICSRCFNQHRDENRRDADSNNCCKYEKESQGETGSERIADLTSSPEEYQEYVEFSDWDDEQTDPPPPAEEETETENSEQQLSNTTDYEYSEDAEPLVYHLPEKTEELNSEHESIPAGDKDTQKEHKSEEHFSALTEDINTTKEEAKLAVLTEDIDSTKQELPKPQESKLAAKKARYKVLLEENKRLKRRQMCRLCAKVPANATLLPCGHLIYCLDCAQSLTHCGACHKEILGDVKTFLS